jgi:NADH-quinone oxidoreductase subunit M
MARLGGNQKLMPIMGGLLGFTAMASLGLPGLAGFWGEFLSLLASFNPLPGLSTTLFRTLMVIGGVGTVLAAGYLLWMLQKVNFGEPKPEWEGHELHDVDKYELAAWVPLVVATIAIGIFPRIVFGATGDAVHTLVSNLSKALGG